MATFLTAVAVWATTGVIIAAVLARHGHNFWLFAPMGLAFGPFLVLIWLEGFRGQTSKSLVVRSNGVVRDTGWINVLVGLDGTASSVESARQVLATLGPAVRRVRLSSAVDHEILNSPEAFAADDQRVAYLNEAAASLGVADVEVVLVSGQPDKALRDHALEHKFDLLVVASRRHPIVSGLRGSTVSRLARTAEIPVLIGPPT